MTLLMTLPAGRTGHGRGWAAHISHLQHVRRLSGFRGNRRVAAEMNRFTSHASPVATWERHGGPGRQVSSSATLLSGRKACNFPTPFRCGELIYENMYVGCYGSGKKSMKFKKLHVSSREKDEIRPF